MIIASDLERKEHDWAALTTSKQFEAIGIYADYFSKKEAWLNYVQKLKKNQNSIDKTYVKKQLVNSWNTERLLHITREQFSGEGVGFVVQWAFPQAYYSVFNSTLASFKCSGFTETSHAALQKKIGDLARLKKLPKGLNVYADNCSWQNGKFNCDVHGIKTTETEYNSVRLDIANKENIKNHIIHFFKSTRKNQIKKQKEKMQIKTKSGKAKVKFNSEDWSRTSGKLGKTSWLSIFYRKRIKSNYHDIDTFLSRDFNTSKVLTGLTKFTNIFNLANELNIAKNCGVDEFKKWIPNDKYPVNKRLNAICELIR